MPADYLSIVGRSKDLIISGGFNVYPKEIETLIDDMPGVAESAVIGVPHADFGEAVVAWSPKAGAALDADAMQAELKARIANFKVPAPARGRRTAAQRHGQGAEERAARNLQGALTRNAVMAPARPAGAFSKEPHPPSSPHPTRSFPIIPKY